MKYRAFISYSHRNDLFAARLHKALESWRADRDLVGRETRFGPVPRDLRPIFRDRDDFASGATLATATAEALEKSQFMIVVCSPAAAASAYVNEEIRTFKALGRANRIIPIIAEGEPGHPELDCFPEALVREISADGQLMDRRVEPLAADARQVGDGPSRATSKLIAGLLGVPFDEIAKRAERTQRRRTQIFASVALTMTVLAVAAAGFGWLAETRRAQADRNFKAAMSAADNLLMEVGLSTLQIEGAKVETTQNVVQRAVEIYERLESELPTHPPTASETVAYRKALAEGAFGAAYSGNSQSAVAATYFEASLKAFENLRKSYPNDRLLNFSLNSVRNDYAISLGALGEMERAKALYESILAEAPKDDLEKSDAEQTLYLLARLQLLALLEQGSADYAALLNVIEADLKPLRAENPNSSLVLRAEMTLAYSRAKDAWSADEPETALELYDEVLRLVESLEAIQSDHQGISPIRGAVQIDRAQILQKLGRLDEAEAARDEAERQSKAAAQRSPDDPLLQAMSDITAASNAITELERGDVAKGAANLRTALNALTDVSERMKSIAPTMGEIDDLLERAVRALSTAKLHSDARTHAAQLLALREDPDNAYNTLGASDSRISNALALLGHATEAAGDLEGALKVQTRRITINEKRMNAGDALGAHILAEALEARGLVLWRLSRRAEALADLTHREGLMKSLAISEPENIALANALGWTQLNVGELRGVTGDTEGARSALKQFWEMAKANYESAPTDRSALIGFAWAEARLAAVGDTAAIRWRNAAELFEKADALSPLSDLDEEGYLAARLSAMGVASDD
ncbi:MAG: toll/interleukin-1 receptor domain-containing protein [Rhodobacteraceae bacterium]|nr:toll/interleukin-1 receptor domain-containing protein [Paracoccaceae bacterium]